MLRPGLYNLGARTITTSLSGVIITEGRNVQGGAIAWLDRLDGMTALSLQAEFAYGSGGTSAALAIQTSLDQGVNWIDICRFDFATASKVKVANLSGLLSKAVTEYAALSAEGVIDGVLGDRLRASLTTVGTYGGNTNLRLWAAAR